MGHHAGAVRRSNRARRRAGRPDRGDTRQRLGADRRMAALSHNRGTAAAKIPALTVRPGRGRCKMNLKLKRTPGIYLVGFMGCGKSTIGRMYAEEIGWRFADLDEDIEQSQQTTISDLFSRFGEEQFRRIERANIEKRIQTVRR